MDQGHGVNGVCAEAIIAAITDARYLLGKVITSGRKFVLKQVWVYNTHATDDAVVTLYDNAEGAAPTAANTKFTFVAAAGTTTLVSFDSPGLEFKTNCVVAQSGGTVAAYHAGGLGFEDGGS